MSGSEERKVEMVELDFEVLRENFSRYVLADGTILKAKVVVSKIFKTPDITPQGYPSGVSAETTNVVAAMNVQPGLKRPPSKEPWNPAKDVGQEIKVIDAQEDWQEYMTTGGLKVLVKPIVTKVFRFDKYNKFGEPVYSVSIQTIVSVEKVGTTATP